MAKDDIYFSHEDNNVKESQLLEGGKEVRSMGKQKAEVRYLFPLFEVAYLIVNKQMNNRKKYSEIR